MMKKVTYILTLCILFVSLESNAQKRTRISKERFQAYKIAYITDQLDLSKEEAEKFWPIYNEHEKKIAELRRAESKEIRQLLSDKTQVDDISESEAKKLVTSMAAIQSKMQSVHLEYSKRLRKVLSYRKILKLQVTEREFKRHIFEKFRKKRTKRE